MHLTLRVFFFAAWLFVCVAERDGYNTGVQEKRDAARTFTNSHVLAFNVTNFMLLLFLKALLVAVGFATGFSGVGLYAGGRADDAPEPPAPDEGQMRRWVARLWPLVIQPQPSNDRPE